MKKRNRRILISMLTAALIASSMAGQFTQRAEASEPMDDMIGQEQDPSIVASGMCGDNLTWSVRTDNTVTINGTGDMWDYGNDKAPWFSYIDAEGEQYSLHIEEGVTSIGSGAFSGRGFTGSLTLPSSIKSIGASAFIGSGFTGRLIIPSGVEQIGDGAFSGCNGFTGELTIPAGLTSIGDMVFWACSGLTGDIVIPDQVASIGSYAFRGCSGFDGKLRIPSSVTTIENAAFQDCTGISEIYFEGYCPLNQFDTDVFLNVNATAYYPDYDFAWSKYNLIGYGGTLTWKATKSVPFEDVEQDDWYYGAVHFVNHNDIMTGLDSKFFGPTENLVRAQFSVVLYRISETPQVTDENKFPDVEEGMWYTDAVKWASDIGIVNGYSDTGFFGPGDSINREQLVTILYRYAKQQGYINIEKKAELDKYSDASYVNGFAREAMRWAVGNGVIRGKDNGTRLDPQGNASRAECAQIIWLFRTKCM